MIVFVCLCMYICRSSQTKHLYCLYISGTAVLLLSLSWFCCSDCIANVYSLVSRSLAAGLESMQWCSRTKRWMMTFLSTGLACS
jgi:hypothetical protein